AQRCAARSARGESGLRARVSADQAASAAPSRNGWRESRPLVLEQPEPVFELCDLELGLVELIAGHQPDLAKDAPQPGRQAVADAWIAAPERQELVGEGLGLLAPEPLNRVCDSPSGLCHADARDAAGDGARASLRRPRARSRRPATGPVPVPQPPLPPLAREPPRRLDRRRRR